MIKKVKYTTLTLNNLKIKFVSFMKKLSIVLILIAIGSFLPNPIVKHFIKKDIEAYYTNWANNLGLQEPAFEYNNDIQFVQAVRKCVDWVNFETPRYERVPVEMIVAQSVLESGWGTSRFAKKGNNLFGIRTYDKSIPHMLLEGTKKWPGWGVRVFTTKCQSVQYFVNLLNTHPAYENFRSKRQQLLILGQELDAKVLVKTLKAYSTTKDYADRVNYIVDSIREQEQSIGEMEIKTKSDSHVAESKDIVPLKKPSNL